MKFKTLTLSTSLVAAFLQFSNVAYAADKDILSDKNMLLEIFKNLTGKEVISKATVSKAFKEAACDPRSPYSVEKNSPEAKTLREFCTVPQVDEATLLKYAHAVLAMKTNPMPTLMNQHDFEHAKDNAKRIVDELTRSSERPSYIN